MTERTFTRAEIEDMAEDNTDRFGNLYRIDFLNHVKHEADLDSP